jgi:RNA polymerase sigma factor (sigma-70 family)
MTAQENAAQRFETVGTEVGISTACIVDAGLQGRKQDWLTDDRKQLLHATTIEDVDRVRRKKLDREWDIYGLGKYHNKPTSTTRLRTSDPVLNMYLSSIENFDLLTASGEKYLSLAMGNDDEDKAIWARDRFISHNLRLPISLARRLPENSRVSLMDHISEGNTGLERAVMKFDPRKGFRFSTIATKWIRQAMAKNRYKNLGSSHLPVEEARLANQAIRDLGEDFFEPHVGRREEDPSTSAELKSHFAQTVGLMHSLSLDAPVTDDGTEFVEIAHAGGIQEPDLNRLMLANALRIARNRVELTDEELYCFYMKYYGEAGDGMTIAEIMPIAGLTRETTSRRIKRVVNEIGNVLEEIK